MNTIEIILFIIAFTIMGLLWYNISRTLKWKGYSTSLGTNPSELVDFIRMIKKEKNRNEKKDYILILIATIFFTVFAFGLFIVIGLNFINHPPR